MKTSRGIDILCIPSLIRIPFYLQIEMFTQALTEGGLTLEEPEANPYDEHDIGTDYDNLDSTKLAYPTPNK